MVLPGKVLEIFFSRECCRRQPVKQILAYSHLSCNECLVCKFMNLECILPLGWCLHHLSKTALFLFPWVVNAWTCVTKPALLFFIFFSTFWLDVFPKIYWSGFLWFAKTITLHIMHESFWCFKSFELHNLTLNRC